MTKHILVIDDEEAVRKSFVLALEDTGYIVDTAESGTKGVQMQTEKKYDVIFLDLKMPGLNGIETLKIIRERDKNIPVYIVTAFHTEFFDQLIEMKEANIHFELLRKPIGADEILQLTTGVIG